MSQSSERPSSSSSSSSAEDDHQIKLPGFGICLDDIQEQTKSLSAIGDWMHLPVTLQERYMLTFMNQVTDKPSWTQKVQNEEIIGKWKKDVMKKHWHCETGCESEDDEDAKAADDFTEEMFEYCMGELRDKAELYEKSSVVAVLDVNSCVLKSDTAIPAELKQELLSAVAPLENVPDNLKDWHPGSNGRVLNLVHPSLFPLIYGRSKILPNSTVDLESCLNNIGEGKVIPEPKPKFHYLDTDIWSRRFQWLPCDVSFPDGAAKITSYINNLHPRDHRGLYRVIEKIIDCAVPFWNIICQSTVLGRLSRDPRIYQCLTDYVFYEDSEEEAVYKGSPGKYDKPVFTTQDWEDKFAFLGEGEKKLQVIVKLANIVLTPDKPGYSGGTWHVEGQLNERIVSTAIYYYDNHNVTDSHLSFRTKVDSDEMTEDNYRREQVNTRGIYEVFGIDDDDEFVMQLGSVLTREDRLIAFPNGLQHRVGSFELADPGKPGHRKILALFLVAPDDPIISTANIPPQQRDWWQREVAMGTGLGNLPSELMDMVIGAVENFPITLDEAKTIRHEVMAERSKMDKYVDGHVNGSFFNLCEH